MDIEKSSDLNLLKSNSNTLLTLEWDQIIAKLKNLTYFQNNKVKLESILSYKEIEEIENEFASIEKHIALSLEHEINTLYEYRSLFYPEVDFEHLTTFISKGGILDTKDINALLNLIGLYFDFERKEFIEPHEGIVDYKKMRADYIFSRKIINEDGEIVFRNHPELNTINNQLLEIDKNVREKVSELQGRSDYINDLQIKGVDIYFEKFVIPVKADHYNHKHGRIISHSDSRATVYVEPQEISYLNSRREELIAKYNEILFKINRDICDKLCAHISLLKYFADYIANFDFYMAKARFCLNNKLQRPTVTETNTIKIDGLFHPLLEDPVTNSITIEEGTNLSITGPNTGGKTVLLKSIILSHMMLQAGLFVPAKNAELKNYKSIYYFGEDNQNIHFGLSSFSAEASNYLSVMERADQDSLVLIDEMFNSTSSEEASALGISLLETLAKNQVKVIISTHHQTLKMFLHESETFESAHMGFDNDTLKPTYKIHFGTPGSSMAIEIFEDISKKRKFGEHIIERSKKFLTNKEIHYEKLLSNIAKKENELNKLLQQNKEINLELKNQKDAHQGILNIEKTKFIKNLETEFDKAKQKAQSVIHEIKANKIKNENKIHQKITEIKSQYVESDIANLFQKRDDQEIKLKDIKIGEYYFSNMLNKEVKVIAINERKKSAKVQNKAITIDIPLSSLVKKGNSQNDVKVSVQSHTEAKLSYKCLGMRLDEFQNLVHSIIPDLLSENIPFVDLIHGHGEGILKKWLRSFVKDHPQLRWEDSQEGNDGSTRIYLKSN